MTSLFGVRCDGALVFDEDRVAEGLALPVSDVLAYFRDGRRGQPIVEKRLAHTLSAAGWRVTDRPTGGGLLFVEPIGLAWELRAITDRVSLAPSRMKGTGRRFNLEAFERGLLVLGGVFVVDVLAFPRCSYWRVPCEELRAWLRRGLLSDAGAIGRPGLVPLLRGFEVEP